MRSSKPLPNHPELTVLQRQNFCEYRVENWRLSRDGTGKVIRNYGWSWLDPLVPMLAAVFWQKMLGRPSLAIAFGLMLALYLYSRCTQVLWESVITLPSLGIQLETHRGLPSMPLFVSRRFIPLIYLEEFVINEGLRRWDVRYYLMAIKNTDGELHLHVAYENILPYFPVLLEVYHGVRQAMFQNLDDVDIPKESREFH